MYECSLLANQKFTYIINDDLMCTIIDSHRIAFIKEMFIQNGLKSCLQSIMMLSLNLNFMSDCLIIAD